jgi:hypothetical protein
MNKNELYKPEISVDCVVFGFDGNRLKVLLLQREGLTSDDELKGFNNRKLPGSIILPHEDLDSAAYRILEEYTGLTNIYLHQFKAFGNPRHSSEADEPWMEKVKRLNISRLVTVGYVALIKINARVKQQSSQKGQTIWLDIEDYVNEHLAFDHKEIIAAALDDVRHTLKYEPYLMFELLPKKFTMTQLRNLHDMIYQKKSDVRNFQKRMMQLEGISALAETEIGVPHRAARYFTYTKRKNRND